MCGGGGGGLKIGQVGEPEPHIYFVLALSELQCPLGIHFKNDAAKVARLSDAKFAVYGQ